MSFYKNTVNLHKILPGEQGIPGKIYKYNLNDFISTPGCEEISNPEEDIIILCKLAAPTFGSRISCEKCYFKSKTPNIIPCPVCVHPNVIYEKIELGNGIL